MSPEKEPFQQEKCFFGYIYVSLGEYNDDQTSLCNNKQSPKEKTPNTGPHISQTQAAKIHELEAGYFSAIKSPTCL